MQVIGIDPSSTCTGVAVVDGPRGSPVFVAGDLLRPSASLGYVERVAVMVSDVLALVGEFPPERVVVEMPDGKRHRLRDKDGNVRENVNMASLAIYGVVAGAIFGALLAKGVPVRAVFVNESSRGMPKRERQRIVAATFPNYRAEKDRGMDVSDAAFLALCEHREAV